MNRRVTIVVSGRVQGVNFRRHTQLTAQRLGVRGWVRNRPDGSVEACFEGEATAVDALVAWSQEGPDYARVDSLELREEPYCGEFTEFQVRH
jgi:acylphosphatase